MVKKFAMIHTVAWYDQAVLSPFGKKFSEQNPDVEIVNIMDDSLLTESLAHGGPTPSVIRRFVHYAMAAEAGGAEVVMSSCTTMAPATEAARSLLSIPIFNIDEPMGREAVQAGSSLGIVATVPTSAPATETMLKKAAVAAGKDIEIQIVINESAFQRLMAGKIEDHDSMVCDEIDKLAERVDVIVLGQVSLAKISHQAAKPILQVAQSGFSEARRLLDLAPEGGA